MIQITIKEAIKSLMSAKPGLYADFVTFFSKEVSEKSTAYKSNGTIIINAFRGYISNSPMWYICDTGNSDMLAAQSELVQMNNNNLRITPIHANESVYGILILSCIGKPYNDPDIRQLCKSDHEQLKSFIESSDDNEDAKDIANNICLYFSDSFFDTNKINIPNSKFHILGLFDGTTLAGAVSLTNKNNAEVICISNIFVSSRYRRRGYATRLIRAALSMYPSIRFAYNCDSNNLPSIASAKSAGFVFEGTYKF